MQGSIVVYVHVPYSASHIAGIGVLRMGVAHVRASTIDDLPLVPANGTFNYKTFHTKERLNNKGK